MDILSFIFIGNSDVFSKFSGTVVKDGEGASCVYRDRQCLSLFYDPNKARLVGTIY